MSERDNVYYVALEHDRKHLQFCLSAGDGCIHYSVAPDEQEPPTPDNVAAMREVPFPTWVVSSGECGAAEQVAVPSVGAGGQQRDGTTHVLGANAPFQVLSDGETIYLFRNSHNDEARIPLWENDPLGEGFDPPPIVPTCSLLVDRYELETPEGNQEDPILKLKQECGIPTEMSPDNPEPTAALIFISGVTNGDFEVTWDEDPSGRGWKTWKVTTTRGESTLVVHYWVQRRPAGFYLESGAMLADPVSDAAADENSERLETASTPAAVADLIWNCWVPGTSPSDMGVVTGLNLRQLMNSDQRVYRNLLGVLRSKNVRKKHRKKAAADVLSWFVVNSALNAKDLKKIMKALSKLSESKVKETEINSLRAIRNLCVLNESNQTICKQMYRSVSRYPGLFPLSTDCEKNDYVNEIYIKLSGLKDEVLSKRIIDTVIKGNTSESPKYITAFMFLSPWVRLLCAIIMMIVMGNMLSVLQSLATHLESIKTEKKDQGGFDSALDALAIAGTALTFFLRVFGGGK